MRHIVETLIVLGLIASTCAAQPATAPTTGPAEPMTLDYEFNDPNDPEQLYFRSDHYSYAAKGIPVIFFTTGLHPDYHRVTDTVEKINFEKMTRIAQMVLETGRRLANLDHAPARDFKGARIGKGASGKIPTAN